MNDFTQEEKDALSDYKTGSKNINLYLRSGWIAPDELDEVKSNIKLLDSAIKKTKLEEPIILYRGTTINEIEDNRVGGFTFIKNFIATSYSIDCAKQFALQNKEKAALLTIQAKKGQHGINIPGIASWARREEEVLLSRDSVFIIKEETTIEDPEKIGNILGETSITSLKLYSLVIIKNSCVKILLKKILTCIKWLKEKFT